MSGDALKERAIIRGRYGENPEFLREYAKQYYSMGWKLLTFIFIGYFLLPVGLVLTDIYNSGPAVTIYKLSSFIDGLQNNWIIVSIFCMVILITGALYYANKTEKRARAIFEMLAEIEGQENTEKKVVKVNSM